VVVVLLRYTTNAIPFFLWGSGVGWEECYYYLLACSMLLASWTLARMSYLVLLMSQKKAPNFQLHPSFCSFIVDHPIQVLLYLQFMRNLRQFNLQKKLDQLEV